MAIVSKQSGISTATGPTWLGESLVTSDTIFWVDSVTGADVNAGEEWLPKATLFGASGAIAACTTSNSNIIVCKKTHRETLTGAYTFSFNGVTVVSLGSGTDRAQIQSAGFTISVSGTEVRMHNLYFPASSGTCTSRITVTGAGFEFYEGQIDSGSNDTTDGLLISAVAHATVRGSTFKATGRPSGTTQRGLRNTGASTNMLVEDCTFDGGTVGYSDACLKIDTATADRFRLRSITLQNYAVAKISTSGIKGFATYTADATSRLDWTE
jgi:hypothetical protein